METTIQTSDGHTVTLDIHEHGMFIVSDGKLTFVTATDLHRMAAGIAPPLTSVRA